MSQPIVLTRELVVPASPAELWPHVSNTNRLNRALGLPAMIKGETKADHGRLVTASLYGFIPLKWTERPFEWLEGKYYRSVRDFDSGPITRFEGSVELEPQGEGTKVKIVSSFTPRNALGSALIKYATGKKAVDDTEAIVREIAENLAKGRGDCFPDRRLKTPAEAGALARRAAALRKDACDARSVERLLEHLSNAHDDELASMRPFELADAWGFDRVGTLKTFLHAVKAGLLDLAWHVLCPNCNGGPGLESLSAVGGKVHCESCDITFGADLADSVELRFAVSPSVRPVERAVFCVGSPAHSRFACAQFPVPKAGRTLELDLVSKSYVVRDLCGQRKATLRPSVDGPSELTLAYGETRAFKPGRVKLTLPGLCESALVRVEAEDWRDRAAKASLVTSLQDFRDLFSSEVLAPGVEISIKNIALLFTDLKGSTAMYEKVGDATAYAIVRDHFDYLFDIVSRRKGAVVKTIGDAVMASFSSAPDALEAALEMQERVEELNQRLAPRPPVVLKIGVHQGPAIAINASGVLDYFGTTANVAARVQNESAGGDVVVSCAVAEDTACSQALDRRQWRSEPFEIQLKGLSDVFTLRRLTRKA